MKRAFYIIGGLTLAISIPSALQAQTTQPKDTTMNRTVVVEQEYNPDIRHDILSGDLRSSRSDAPLHRKRNTTRQHSRICACRLWQLRQSRCTRQLFIPLV